MCSVICWGRNESRQQVFKRKKNSNTRETRVWLRDWVPRDWALKVRQPQGPSAEHSRCMVRRWAGKVMWLEPSGKGLLLGMTVESRVARWRWMTMKAADKEDFAARGRHTIAWLATITVFSKALDKAHTYHAIMDGTCGSSVWARDLDCGENVCV